LSRLLAEAVHKAEGFIAYSTSSEHSRL
jgi:hypothetical protein